MKFFLDKNGNFFALDEATGETYQYFSDSDDLGELSGFWSSVGNALKQTGKWIGKNVVPGVAGAVTTYFVANSALSQQQQQAAQQQTATATPPAQDNSFSFGGNTLLLVGVGVGAVLLLTRR